jgi:hypothetical protein
MAEEQASNGKPFDPLESLRQMRDTYLDACAKAMIGVVNTDAYARASGSMVDTFLTMSAPFRETFEKTMLQTLTQLNMPSKADVISLAGRLTNVEMRLDDMDAKLDRIAALLTKPARKPAARRGARKGVR